MSAQVIALTGPELDTLHGAGPLAFTAYVLMRSWMDYRTGVTGTSRPISLAMLADYTETHTPRGAGHQVEKPSTREIRTALERLTRSGLLRRLAGDRLAFSLPLARTAQARPFQTRQGADTELSTEAGIPKAARAVGYRPTRDAKSLVGKRANPTHFMYQVNKNPTAAPVGNFGQGCRSEREGLAAREGRGPKASAGPDRLLRLGEGQGKPPRPGESWQDYRARLLQTRPTIHQEAAA